MVRPVTQQDPSLEAVLKDGTRVRFRRIAPGDKQRLQDGLRRLSPESRYRRFFSPLDHLSDEMLQYFTEVDHVDHVAWLGILADSDKEEAVAVARFVRIPGQPGSAEAAVTVLDEYQGRGLGRAMLVVLSRDAIARGVRRFTMFVLSENQAMMGLLHDAGARSDGVHDGVFQMHVDLPERVDDLDETAAPRVLRVAAAGKLQGQVVPGKLTTHFLVGKR